ncbi:nucleotidyl transferase AbiEii/AbiGii toxin family protein [Actinophytocola glycyrrhizae]|uniref:Nucleotidyl transferase AbiEii/AbiGii toxin family protein n=1 Tax=Actinophytocola glycyrrhizae TaxID=2044873 RepID=A0ABV9S453_9PSEU
MNRPTRQTAGGRAYLDLQNRARREKRTTQELLTLYVLERWLARLAASRHVQAFVLKGGLLLSVFDARRPTADADLLARNLANDQETVIRRVREITAVTFDEDDGVIYLPDTITAQTIRDDADYAGVRITMDCHLATATVKLKLDINIGDPVTPAPRLIDMKSQRADLTAVRILGYPIETVLAEKTSTAIALGEANTRVRDYADLYTLTGRHPVSYYTMCAALNATMSHRGVSLRPLSQALGGFGSIRQSAYGAFRRRLGPDGLELPATLTEVVAAVCEFVDPLVAAGSFSAWSPDLREWK